MAKLIGFVTAGIFVIVAGLFISLLLSLPVMLLWNWVAVGVLSLPVISWFQAWGLSLLCSLLFKSSCNCGK